MNFYLGILALATTIAWGSLSAAEDVPYLACFEIASERHRVPLETLIGVASVESGFNPDARSSANAHGIMQIRWPVTARHLGVRRVSELYNPCVNIDIGAGYLAELLDRYDGNQTLALAAYNFGPTRLRTEADIPTSVSSYVQKVRANESRMSTAQPSLATEIVLNEFDRQDQAFGYTNSVNRFITTPAVRMFSVPGPYRSKRYRVVLNTTELTQLDRIRLARIVNLEETGP